MTTYTFFSDPGHGWLKVSRNELKELGIADKISVYSYEYGDSVYLEEDCDATTFLTIKKNLGHTFKIVEKNSDNDSRIRKFDSYRNI